MSRSKLRPILGIVVASLLLAACGSEPQPFTGYSRVPAPNLATVSLPMVDETGEETPYNFQAEPDHILLVYFGYTSCPDACPTTLADARRAREEIGGDDAERIDMAMVTIDVDVDTPQILNDYLHSFFPDGAALRTTNDDDLRAVAYDFGADYGKSDQDGAEEVYHSTALYAVDDQGELVMTWPFGTTAEALQSDMERLLAGDRA